MGRIYLDRKRERNFWDEKGHEDGTKMAYLRSGKQALKKNWYMFKGCGK